MPRHRGGAFFYGTNQRTSVRHWHGDALVVITGMAVNDKADIKDTALIINRLTLTICYLSGG